MYQIGECNDIVFIPRLFELWEVLELDYHRLTALPPPEGIRGLQPVFHDGESINIFTNFVFNFFHVHQVLLWGDSIVPHLGIWFWEGDILHFFQTPLHTTAFFVGTTNKTCHLTHRDRERVDGESATHIKDAALHLIVLSL